MAQRGLSMGGNPMQILEQFKVRNPNMKEVIYEPLYDSQTLPAAGASNISFFQQQIGINGKTLSDTNMELQGQLPNGKAFLVTGISVGLYVGGESDGAAKEDIINDLRAFNENGALRLSIQSKDYMRQAPLGKFPEWHKLEGFAATTVASSEVVYAQNTGREFQVLGLAIPANTNFKLSLEDIPALPSGNDARIMVTLDGFTYRLSQ